MRQSCPWPCCVQVLMLFSHWTWTWILLSQSLIFLNFPLELSLKHLYTLFLVPPSVISNIEYQTFITLFMWILTYLIWWMEREKPKSPQILSNLITQLLYYWTHQTDLQSQSQEVSWCSKIRNTVHNVFYKILVIRYCEVIARLKDFVYSRYNPFSLQCHFWIFVLFGLFLPIKNKEERKKKKFSDSHHKQMHTERQKYFSCESSVPDRTGLHPPPTPCLIPPALRN